MKKSKILSCVGMIAILAFYNPLMAKPVKKFSPIISEKNLTKDVKIVSSDEFAGRGVGTIGETKTIEFMSKEFAKAGFAAGGPNGQWTQEVKLRKFEIKNPVLNLKLGEKNKNLNIGEDITASTRGALGDVIFKDAPLVFVGYGINAPERQWNDFKDKNGKEIDVRGKIIVVLINDADYYAPELNSFGGKAMTYYGRWTYKFEEAARRGALGCIIIHETGPASYGWATVKNSNNGSKLDIVRKTPTDANPILESWMSYSQAEEMFKVAGLNLEEQKKAARSKDFAAIELNNIKLDGEFKVETKEIISHNVVAILKGKTRPDETILYGAHWDHLGIGAANEKGDKIFNGALDNGTGIAAMLELARNFAKAPKPERSIVMIGFTAEESGLLGSEYYANNPIYPLEKSVLGINMDGLNILGRTKDITVVGWGQSNLEKTLEKYAKIQKRYLVPEETPQAGYFFRSDHFPFVKRGVPFVNAGSGNDMVIGGKAAGIAASEDYVEKNYHQQSDEWSPKWNLSGMIEDLQIYYAIGNEFANSKEWPKWNENSEFKAMRDKSENIRK